MSVIPETVDRVEAYCRSKNLALVDRLGFGVHGSVFAAENQRNGRITAIKVHERERFYLRERNIYLRLQENSATYIHGAAVPELIAYDDELWVIEMTIVARPFVLDFAGADRLGGGPIDDSRGGSRCEIPGVAPFPPGTGRLGRVGSVQPINDAFPKSLWDV